MKELDFILDSYGFNDNLIKCEKYGNGHINETYLCETESEKYIVQGVNKSVFPAPHKIIENILHLQHSKPENNTLLPLVPCNQQNYFYDLEQYLWRVFPFAKAYTSYEEIEDMEIAHAVGKAYGNFVIDFSDIDATNLFPTIPDFHNAPKRYKKLEQSFHTASPERKEKGEPYFQIITKYKELFTTFQDSYKNGTFPTRVTHNDTKINNVLIGKKNFADVKVIDLDTVMAGTVLYDFGDMCRSAANTGGENTKNAEDIQFDVNIFRELSKGYSVTKNILLQSEKEALIDAIQYMTLMLATRFLDDFFCGDTYFKVSYPEENLVRARNQILLFKDIEKKKEELTAIIRSYFS